MNTLQNKSIATSPIIKSSQTLAWFICSLGALFYCYEYFLRIAPSIMVTQLREAFMINATAFGNLVACYYYAYTPMQLVVGILMDRYGPRRLLVIACLCCAVGVYLFASTTNLRIAQLGRFLVGFGSAFAFVGTLKLATVWLPPNRFAFISGLTAALGMLGAIIGDITLTQVVNHLGWRLTNHVSALCGILLSMSIWLIVKDHNPTLQSHESPTDSQNFRALFTALKKLLRNPQIWIAALVGLLTYLSASAFAEVWGITYLKTAYQLTEETASQLTSIVFLGWVIGGPLTGWISDHIKLRKIPLLIASLLTALCFALLIFGEHYANSTLALLLFGVGLFSSAEILVFAIACEISSIRLAGTALAFINMGTMVGGSIAQPLIGYMLDLHWHGSVSSMGSRIYDSSDFQFALSILPIGYLCATILCIFFLRESYQRKEG